MSFVHSTREVLARCMREKGVSGAEAGSYWPGCKRRSPSGSVIMPLDGPPSGPADSRVSHRLPALDPDRGPCARMDDDII